MALGLIARKAGMTQVFTEAGESIPVTVLAVEPNRVTQIKTLETDGYSAVQVTTGQRKLKRVTKPLANHYAKAKVPPGNGLWEFHVDTENNDALALGSEISVDIFAEGQYVDVTGTSKGKGFSGTIKRHNFRGQDTTHGNSLSHRVPGSIGQNQTPGRVFKGKKMAGQLGNVRKTIQNLQIVRVDQNRQLLLIKGAIPGATNGYVMVRPAVKKSHKKGEQ